ncbi:MAG TPA: hypothetical protein VLS51_00605, partial [Propionibacteriaceae bacterium]|nr:hypothetical protein [Propionibacteriaceae bacterium]
MRNAVLLCVAGLGCVAIAASCSSTEVTGDAGPEASSIWDGNRAPYDGAQPPPVPRVPVSAQLVSSRVDAQGMMFAAGEMQISGEPFAEFFAGRNPTYYDRLYLPPDRYLVPDPVTHVPAAIVDPFGFSTMVESYEYSKYHMNSLVEVSGAGVSLVNGPMVLSGTAATPQDRLALRVSHVLQSAGTDVAGYATVPPPTNNPLNLLGFPGLRPVMAPYRDFDPTIAGTLLVVSACVTVTGYQGIPLGGSTPEYECDYSSLHLGEPQLTHAIVPAVLGFTTWKEALWGIDFVGRLHDTLDNPVDTVADADRASVGKQDNTVLGIASTYTMAGTYLGSTSLEGMWGLTMIDGMDNLDEWLLSSLTTQDGATLGGFATKSDAL